MSLKIPATVRVLFGTVDRPALPLSDPPYQFELVQTMHGKPVNLSANC